MGSPSATHATHAVVIGAGPAGVAAALALAARTERVTLVDRADVPGPEWEARPRSADVRAVLASPQVVVRAGLEVVGLIVRDDGRAGGVLVRSRRAGVGAALTEIFADLVVDARGPVPAPARIGDLSAPVTRQGRGHEGPRPEAAGDAGGWTALA